MKQFFLFIIISLLCTLGSQAEVHDNGNLYIHGSAIPGGCIKLTATRTGYIYQGELLSGNFKITDTKDISKSTKYTVPQEEYCDVTGTSSLMTVTDRNIPGWDVMVADKNYRIFVDLSNSQMKSELNYHRCELFMIGGAAGTGWDPHKAIAFKQDSKNPNLFVFRGQLAIHKDSEQSNLFKIIGQHDWSPYSLHPISMNEDILKSRYVEESVGDNKWAITEGCEGEYVITVNTLYNTISAKLIKKAL